jgi:hypothetical protein
LSYDNGGYYPGISDTIQKLDKAPCGRTASVWRRRLCHLNHLNTIMSSASNPNFGAFEERLRQMKLLQDAACMTN